MVAKIVGKERLDLAIDDYKFNGYRYHVVDMQTQKAGLEGMQVTTFKIPDSSPLSSVPYKVGNTYTVYFAQGRKDPEFIMEFKEPSTVK